MRIEVVGLVSFLFICLSNCSTQKKADVDSKRLYETFNLAYRVSQKRLQEVNADRCAFFYGDVQDPFNQFNHLLYSFSDSILNTKNSSGSLSYMCEVIIDYSQQVDSLFQVTYIPFDSILLITKKLSPRITSREPFTPSDTTLILSEATRVLLQSMSLMAGGSKMCGWGDDVPYVVVSPLPKTDSFSVRVGLRMPSVCPSRENYATVLGDTIPYLSYGWADATFHRRQLTGVDTLWVKSCLGNPLTGKRTCWDVGAGVGW